MKSIAERQRSYFSEGHTLPIAARRASLKKLLRLLMENETLLARAIYKDFRKPYYVTMENELSLAYGEINRAIQKLGKWSSPKWYRPNMVNVPARARAFPVPYGSALVIGPWNYPYMLSLIPVISAMAAGNTVVLKPSELTSYSSHAMAELINHHFPEEMLHVVEGGVQETQALLSQKFDKIFFTGSSRVGKIVMKAAAEHLTPVTLELGGKNPVIVLPDCNLKLAAKRIAWGMLHNNGQACVSPDHVYAHASIKEALLEEMKNALDYILKGDARRCHILPRIINKPNFDRLASMIDPAKVYTGGEASRHELFIEPTILSNVSERDLVMQEEIFGPILPVLEYHDLEKLLCNIKQKPTPLAAYIFTGNRRAGKRILKELPTGGGMINDTVLHFINMNTPFGGLGESGMGSYHGKAGFDAFSHYKTILVKANWFELFLKYPPYKRWRFSLFRVILGRSIRNLGK